MGALFEKGFFAYHRRRKELCHRISVAVDLVRSIRPFASNSSGSVIVKIQPKRRVDNVKEPKSPMVGVTWKLDGSGIQGAGFLYLLHLVFESFCPLETVAATKTVAEAASADGRVVRSVLRWGSTKEIAGEKTRGEGLTLSMSTFRTVRNC